MLLLLTQFHFFQASQELLFVILDSFIEFQFQFIELFDEKVFEWFGLFFVM